MDGDECWSMGIQLVVRLACMSANIGGMGFGLAACLAVEVEGSGSCVNDYR